MEMNLPVQTCLCCQVFRHRCVVDAPDVQNEEGPRQQQPQPADRYDQGASRVTTSKNHLDPFP